MIKPGTRLLTKDGRKIGNAIVVHQYIYDDTQYEDKEPVDDIWVIETDFGNLTRMSEDQMRDLWHINEPCELEIMQGEDGGGRLISWMIDRYRLITRKTLLSPAGRGANISTDLSILTPIGNFDIFALQSIGKASTADQAKEWAKSTKHHIVSYDYVKAVTSKKEG